MQLFAVKTRIIKVKDNLIDVVLESLSDQQSRLEDNDVLVVTSKIVSVTEDRVVKLSSVKVSKKGKAFAEKYGLKPEFGELVLREADGISGGVSKAVLTVKKGMLVANAGIDNKNVPEDSVVLWPSDPERSVAEIRDEIRRRTGKKIGVLLIDSGLIPLRIGTTGLALAAAGFNPIKDDRGGKDLFGKRIMITRQAVADDLASAAHLLMGEATNHVPIVLIRDAPLDFDGNVYGPSAMKMPRNACIFMGCVGKGPRAGDCQDG